LFAVVQRPFGAGVVGGPVMAGSSPLRSLRFIARARARAVFVGGVCVPITNQHQHMDLLDTRLTLSRNAKLCSISRHRQKKRHNSTLPCQFPPSPMMVLPVGVEHALDVPVQRPHDADARKHRRAAPVFWRKRHRLIREGPVS
jgi:hypothetical protein